MRPPSNGGLGRRRQVFWMFVGLLGVVVFVAVTFLEFAKPQYGKRLKDKFNVSTFRGLHIAEKEGKQTIAAWVQPEKQQEQEPSHQQQQVDPVNTNTQTGDEEAQPSEDEEAEFKTNPRVNAIYGCDMDGSRVWGCREGATLTVEGVNFSGNFLHFIFVPAADSSSGSQPECLPVKIINDTTATCTFTQPREARGLWNVHVRGDAGSSLSLGQKRSPVVYDASAVGQLVTGIQGCDEVGCMDGALLTVYGKNFQKGARHTTIFLHPSDAQNDTQDGLPRDPIRSLLTCVTKELYGSPPTSVLCVLKVPQRSSIGVYSVSTAAFRVTSSVLVRITRGSKPTILGVRCEVQEHSSTPRCIGGKRMIVQGTGLNGLKEVTFELHNVTYPSRILSEQSLACTDLRLISTHEASCLLSGTRFPSYWQVGGVSNILGRLDSDVVIRYNPEPLPFYDPHTWPPKPLGPPEEWTLPLTESWKMYEDVSIVYTWVNGSEPADKELRNQYGGRDKVDNSQNRDNGELRFSLRAYQKYVAPWHKGRIFIVSPGHVPTWLDTSNPRVTIVNQDYLIPDKSKLPVFSSNNIEPYLYRIPGLSKFFIHMNDDYFFLKATHPKDFFLPGPDGGTRFYMGVGHMSYPQNNWNPTMQVWKAMSLHTWDIMEERYGPTKRYYLKHAPFAYHRDAFPILHQLWGQYFNMTLDHKFRHWDDVITPIMHNSFVLKEGAKYGLHGDIQRQPELHQDNWFVGIRDNVKGALTDMNKLKEGMPRNYVLNDIFNNRRMSWLVQYYLQLMYTEPSQFEMPSVPHVLPDAPPDLLREIAQYQDIPFAAEILKKYQLSGRSLLRGA